MKCLPSRDVLFLAAVIVLAFVAFSPDSNVTALQAQKADVPRTGAMPQELEWELIKDNFEEQADLGYVYRAKVIGGWLVSIFDRRRFASQAGGCSLTFVPDKSHSWVVATREK